MFGSMLHTYLIAQVFGVYLCITAIILLSRVNYFQDLVTNLKANDYAVMATACSGLLLGIFLVDIHNDWEFRPNVAVTLLCWWILVKSVLWLAIPEKMLFWTQQLFAGNTYYLIAAIMGLIGIFFLAAGYHPVNDNSYSLITLFVTNKP